MCDLFNMSDNEYLIDASDIIESGLKFKCEYCNDKFCEKSLLELHLKACSRAPSTSNGKQNSYYFQFL